MKYLYKKLQVIFGILIFGLLIYKIGFFEIIDSIKSMNIYYFLLAVLIYIFSLLMGGFNVIILIKGIRNNFNKLEIFKSYILSSSVSLLFPGKLGELSLIYYLNKDEFGLGEGSAILFMDKIITILILIVLAFFSALIYFGLDIALKLLGLGVVILIVLVIPFLWKRSRNLIKKYILRKYAGKFKGFSRIIKSYFSTNKKYLFLNIIITIFRWFVRAIFIYVIFLGLGVEINLLVILLILSLETYVSLIPITINGLGTKHAVSAYAYNYLLNILPEFTIARLVIGHIIRYGLSAVVLIFMKKKINT